MRRAGGGPHRSSLRQAFDELRFGSARTLNLREALPTAADATARADAWLRQHQARGSREVLVITGRGNSSVDGISVVREAVLRLLYALKRRGVVAEHHEHTAGSFVATLAPLSALFDAPKRQRDKSPPPPAPASLAALGDETRQMLNDLAKRALYDLGVRDPVPFTEGEMLKQFGALAAGIPPGPDRERLLRAALRRALDE